MKYDICYKHKQISESPDSVEKIYSGHMLTEAEGEIDAVFNVVYNLVERFRQEGYGCFVSQPKHVIKDIKIRLNDRKGNITVYYDFAVREYVPDNSIDQ